MHRQLSGISEVALSGVLGAADWRSLDIVKESRKRAGVWVTVVRVTWKLEVGSGAEIVCKILRFED